MLAKRFAMRREVTKVLKDQKLWVTARRSDQSILGSTGEHPASVHFGNASTRVLPALAADQSRAGGYEGGTVRPGVRNLV